MRKAGRPRYEPTDADRNRVRVMAASGLNHDRIALCIGESGISRNTLEKYYRRELDTAAEMANAAVSARAFEMATKSENPAWAIFWLKCRAGWKETSKLEHTGADGAPLVTLADLDRIVGDDKD